MLLANIFVNIIVNKGKRLRFKMKEIKFKVKQWDFRQNFYKQL